MSRAPAAAIIDALGTAAARARAAADLEAALAEIGRVVRDTLGFDNAALRPGALKEGERIYRVAGTFLITPDRAYNMLAGSHGFPPEQRRLMIPIGWNHPGAVVETRRSLLLANTDEHDEFRQFLKTSRMGSSIYAPIVSDGVMVGQLVCAAQARHTFGTTDLERLEAFASLASLAWQAFDGARWLAAAYPPEDAWRADERALESSR